MRTSQILAAAARSGDHGTLSLAMQLTNTLPCTGCGFVHQHCRCDYFLQRCNRAWSHSRSIMMGLRSEGPFTPLDFVYHKGEIKIVRHLVDGKGVAVHRIETHIY
jgi:hypothetical protein